MPESAGCISTPVVHTPRKVPVALKDRIKTDLYRMITLSDKKNHFRRESGCLNGWCVFMLPKSDRLRTLHFALVSSWTLILVFPTVMFSHHESLWSLSLYSVLEHTVLIFRNMNKVPNQNLKLNYVRGVVMIIIQEIVAQLKGCIVCRCFCESSYVRAMSRAFFNVRSDPSFIDFSLTFEDFFPNTILFRTILSGFSYPQSLTKTFKSVTNSSQDSIVFCILHWNL
jgi:hypothetical protein